MTQHSLTAAPLPRARRCACLAVLVAAAASCFEQPVTERMAIRFLAGGEAVVSCSVRLGSPESFRGKRLARERIDETRRALGEGRDDWSRRFAALGPERERLSLDRRDGEIETATRWALVEDASRLPRFFADTPVAAAVASGDGWREISLFPGGSGRASPRERREVRAVLEAWSAEFGKYVSSVADLYAYLEKRPDRARPCFAKLFGDIVAEEQAADVEPTDPEERNLLDRISESILGTLAFFEVGENEAYSFQEKTRLVYDPFPAPLLVSVPGPVLESEGFATIGERRLAVPGLGVADALRDLEGTWLSPDPLLVFFEAVTRGEDEKGWLDLDSFAARERRWTDSPSPEAVLGAIDSRLVPAPCYRVRWAEEAAEPERTDPDDPEAWERLLRGDGAPQ